MDMYLNGEIPYEAVLELSDGKGAEPDQKDEEDDYELQ